MAKPYDGRELEHPDHGKPVRIWDFTGLAWGIAPEHRRWLCEFSNEALALYHYCDDDENIWLDCDLEATDPNSGWGLYIKNSNPPHELAGKATSNKNQCTCSSLDLWNFGCPKMRGEENCV